MSEHASALGHLNDNVHEVRRWQRHNMLRIMQSKSLQCLDESPYRLCNIDSAYALHRGSDDDVR
eukprot:5866705-Alexandrium_andersonii.AAC.1